MKIQFKYLFFILAGCFNIALSDDMKSYYIKSDFIPDANISKAVWSNAKSEATIIKDWKGTKDYPQYKTTVKSLWSDSFLYIIFKAPFDKLSTNESIKVNEHGDSFGIWKHDVVELFITENPDIRRYYEFNVSPIGQKIDISHDKSKPEPNYDPNWSSDWKVAVKLDKAAKIWVTEMRIPFSSITQLNAIPGRKLRFNLFRCVGNRPETIFLAMNPTFTETPKFHVPDKFGTLELIADNIKLPDPVLYFNFEGPQKYFAQESKNKILKGQGVAGTSCFDAAKGPLEIEKEAIPSSLNDFRSLTITGWFKIKYNFNDLTNTFILNYPDRFRITSNGATKGRMGMDLLGTAEKVSVWSSWFAPFLADERWMFFAFTYDGTKNTENGKVYVGTEEYPVEIETFSTGACQLKADLAAKLVIGGGNAAGGNNFKGKIDNIRIFASRDDGLGALSPVQVELLRQADVGIEYSKKLATKRQHEESLRNAKIESAKKEYWNKEFNAIRVDSLDRVFTDLPSMPPEFMEPISVPCGGKAAFQFALMSRKIGECDIKISLPKGFDDKNALIYCLKSVHIEANNNGGIRTSLYTTPPGLWLETTIRKAPFDLGEVLIPGKTLKLEANRYQAVLIDVNVPESIKPGLYKFKATFVCNDKSIDVPFELNIHKVKVESKYALSSTHWLWPQPENLTNTDIPQWWSERHWKLLEQSGLALRAFGQDTMFTPLIDGEYPLIKTIHKKDGTFTFDFSQFNRWIEMFSKQGFIAFDGHQIGGGHRTSPMEVVAFDEANNVNYKLFSKDSDPNKWFDFIPVFYQALYKDLKSNGNLGKYHQCQLDEPSSETDYKKLAGITRKYMPDVLTKDAINGNPAKYSPLVDIQVFGISILNTSRDLAEERKKNGQQTWVYHCASPYPPMPNRHLDDPLSMSRLYPWFAFELNASGYLNWAANIYRGANPYISSIGPLPNGSTNPGHPPGDNWFFYPGPDGLYASMRMVAFRDGMLDHQLLTMLAQKNQAMADSISNNIAKSLIDYKRDAASYHRARKELLNALDKFQ